MRLRTLLVTTVTGTLLAGAVGAVGVPAQANRAPSLTAAGSLVAWGGEPAGDARTVPADLTGPVADVATSNSATAAVTADGKLRVWGTGPEVDFAPTGITNAVAVALAYGHGAILHADGKVTAWGDPEIEAVPSDLRAKAIAVGAAGTAFAVRTNGELMTWGAEGVPIPEGGLDNLVDVSLGTTGQVLALHANGTIESLAMDPSLATVPDLGGKKVTQVVAGAAANGLVLEDGTIKVWGAAAPADEPGFGGKKVVSLALGTYFFSAIGGAVTEDGVVHTWGVPTGIAEHPAALTGQPAADISMGMQHAVVIVTSLQDLTKPTITGTPQVGQTLTAKPATFNLTPTTPATGQWYADAAPIAGKTGTTLVLDQAVVGKKISYRTTATRSGKTVTSASNELGPVTAVIAPPPAAKAKSTVSATVKATGKTKTVAKKVTITVTVKTTKGVSPAGKVTVTLKGKTKKKITATVNANGKAKVTFKKVKHGKYKAALAYAGNSNVASSKATKKFKA
jgi:hypothetical protein